MSGVALTVCIVAFDATIISTILPRVALALDGMALYAWAGTGYFLACAVTILIFGRLGDLYGRKPLMLISLVLVGLGSLLSGFSQSMGQLIAFRVLQGLGGGMMIATAFAAPADLFPNPKDRVRWMVMLSSTFAVASGMGPVLGGVVTQALGWRAAFFVIPITAVFSWVMIWRYFPLLKPERPSSLRFDWMGVLLLVIAVGAPLVGLELLAMKQTTVPTTLAVALMVSSPLAALGLIAIEKRAAVPIFPLRILQTAQARYLNAAALLSGAVMFTLIYFVPLQSQDVFGFSPTVAGALMTPLVAGIPIGSIINGRLFRREVNPQRLMTIGSLFLGMGCALTLTFTQTSPILWVLIVMALSGLGLGFLLPNFTLLMQIVAEPADVGVASALIQTTRAVGSAVGTALVGMAITYLSVRAGLRLGLLGSVVLCVLMGWLCAQVRMDSYRPKS
jgi:MFS family permease